MEANSPPPEVMWSISQIAERDGVSKPTISNHVARLIEQHNLTHTRDSRGRVSAVDVFEYDALRERYGHGSRAQAPTNPGELPLAGSLGDGAPHKTSLDEAQRQKTLLDAAKRRIEVGELTRRLIRADKFAAAVVKCAEEVNRVVDRLPQRADAFARALDLDDVHRCRLALKEEARQLRTDLADALDRLAAEAPATDEPLAEADDEEM